MTFSATLFSTIFVLPLARGVAFGGPAPTAASTDHARAVDSFGPNPTKGPSVAELRKRSSLDAETCGFVDGDYNTGVTCNGFGDTCMLYTTAGVGMAGCCTGSDTQNCGWVSSCVDYDAYTSSNCDSDCMLNTFIRKCTNALYPYCNTWTYPGDNVADYGCTDTKGGAQTVRFSGTDSYGTTISVSVPTIGGDAVDLSASATDSSSAFSYSAGGSSGGGSSYGKKKGKKVNVRLIAGAVIGALMLLFVAIAAVIFICVKKKKSRQLAANQQAVTAAQANQPQSAYPPQPPMQQQQPVAPPMPPQTPQPLYNGYFPPQGQQDQKFNPQTQVHEYGVQSPVSNPSTPAPAYVQPYYAAPSAAPPMPTQSPAPYQTREPVPGALEVDSMPASHPPALQLAGHGHNGPVYEMGGHR